MIIYPAIESLLYYAQAHLLLDDLDVVYVRNRLLDELKLTDYEEYEVDYEAIDAMTAPDDVLNPIVNYAVENGIVTEDQREYFGDKIMSIVMMKPFEVVGYKVQFTQMEGDNAGCCFCENEIGFGLNEHTKLEGFRKNNLIATWMLGPVLPLNPDLTAWLLKQATGDSCRPAYEKESRACYERRLTEFRIPGVGMHV